MLRLTVGLLVKDGKPVAVDAVVIVNRTKIDKNYADFH